MHIKKRSNVLKLVLRSSDVMVRFRCIGNPLFQMSGPFLLDPADAGLTPFHLCQLFDDGPTIRAAIPCLWAAVLKLSLASKSLTSE
jgi:hypothetical protein